MLEKLQMATKPDKDLFMAFVMLADSKDADNLLIEFVMHRMRRRLDKQRQKGFSGWNTAQVANEDLLRRCKSNLDSGDFIDVINLAAMLLARQGLFREIELRSSNG